MCAPNPKTGFSSKVYLSALAGYKDIPTVEDILTTFLPQFTMHAHRYLLIDNEAWEIWSPNSSDPAYYPGIRKVALDFEDPAPTPIPFADGHFGRFDTTMNPQLFDPLKPWLPFIRKAGSPTNRYPELIPFLDTWDDCNNRVLSAVVEDFKGRLKAMDDAVRYCEDYAVTLGPIWTNKPAVPTEEDLVTLANCSSPVEANFLYAALQRLVKEVAGWSRFVQV